MKPLADRIEIAWTNDLSFEQVLKHVRRFAIGVVAQHVDVGQAHERRRHAAIVVAADAPERLLERQVRCQ